MAEVLKQAIDDGKLTGKVYMDTDNCKNIVNAVVEHLEVFHLPCIGHTLQLAVEKAFHLSDVMSVLGRVRKLVGHFKKSSKATYSLREKQQLLGLPQHELIQQCDTRWGSVYNMLERFMEQQPALCAVLLESSDRVHRGYLPEERECNVIEELVTILKPFVQATTLMSGSKYPTDSIICPLLYQLLQKTLSVANDDSPTTKKIKNAI